LPNAGINWVTTHFFEGFGYEIESEEMTNTTRIADPAESPFAELSGKTGLVGWTFESSNS